MQTELGLVQRILHAPAGEQRAIQPIGPLMIRADETISVAGPFLADQRAPMTANIMEGMNRTIFAADDDNGVRVDLEREIVARRRNGAGVSGEQPPRAPDPGQVKAIHFRIRIEVAGESPPGTGLGDERFDSGLHRSTERKLTLPTAGRNAPFWTDSFLCSRVVGRRLEGVALRGFGVRDRAEQPAQE